MEISFIVLAGGRSLRLGRDKIKEILGEKSLLRWVISSISHFNYEIVIVTAKQEPVPASISGFKVRMTGDIYPEKGSLGGIYSGIAVSKSFYNFVIAGDMPFLNRGLMQYMMDITNGFDLVLPRFGEIVEPLHAIYSRSCMAYMEDLLKQDELQILKFFPSVNTRYIENDEVDKFDPEHLSFFNINTENDLKKARLILEKGDNGAKR